MIRYHINNTGNITKCRATKEKCPFGGDTGTEEHFDTREDARAHYESKMKESSLTVLQKKTPNANNKKTTKEELDKQARELINHKVNNLRTELLKLDKKEYSHEVITDINSILKSFEKIDCSKDKAIENFLVLADDFQIQGHTSLVFENQKIAKAWFTASDMLSETIISVQEENSNNLKKELVKKVKENVQNTKSSRKIENASEAIREDLKNKIEIARKLKLNNNKELLKELKQAENKLENSQKSYAKITDEEKIVLITKLNNYKNNKK